MGGAQGRDLRRMRHHQNLRVVGQAFQPPPHGIRRGPAHAPVDLVEDQHKRVVAARQAHLQRQQEPRQFPARRDLVQGACRRAGIGGHREGHVVAPIGSGLAPRDKRLEDRAFHLQRHQFGRHRTVQGNGHVRARARHGIGCGVIGGVGIGHLPLQRGNLRLARVDLAQAVAQFIRQSGQVIG